MINGRRRDHGFERAHLELFEQGKPVKCNPLAWWEFKDCFNYIEQQGLEAHPLHEEVHGRSCQNSLPSAVTVTSRMMIFSRIAGLGLPEQYRPAVAQLHSSSTTHS